MTRPFAIEAYRPAASTEAARWCRWQSSIDTALPGGFLAHLVVHLHSVEDAVRGSRYFLNDGDVAVVIHEAFIVVTGHDARQPALVYR